jgi:hypothetical protein
MTTLRFIKELKRVNRDYYPLIFPTLYSYINLPIEEISRHLMNIIKYSNKITYVNGIISYDNRD